MKLLRLFQLELDLTVCKNDRSIVWWLLINILFVFNFSFVQDEEQWFCVSCDCFLADRFVEGTCPDCGRPAVRLLHDRTALQYISAFSHQYLSIQDII